MDKAYYATLKTRAEQLLYKDEVQKARKKYWDDDNADKVHNHRRATTLKRCLKRCSVPTKNTVMRYNYTKEELRPIFESMWENWTNEKMTNLKIADDKSDSVEDGT